MSSPSPNLHPETTPVRLDLKKDKQLEIEWEDGHKCVYTLEYLRTKCPCAVCKAMRDEQAQRKSLLNVLPGNFSGPLTVKDAALVGSYALRIEWSDEHDTGIYSFQYLREICPDAKQTPSCLSPR